jgi:hypothetical protein
VECPRCRLRREFVVHYHGERYHQGLGGRIIRPMVAANDNGSGKIVRRSRLGGLLNRYHRRAA